MIAVSNNQVVLIVVEQVVEKSSSPSPKKMFRHRNMMEFYEYTDYLIEWY